MPSQLLQDALELSLGLAMPVKFYHNRPRCCWNAPGHAVFPGIVSLTDVGQIAVAIVVLAGFSQGLLQQLHIAVHRLEAWLVPMSLTPNKLMHHLVVIYPCAEILKFKAQKLLAGPCQSAINILTKLNAGYIQQEHAQQLASKTITMML